MEPKQPKGPFCQSCGMPMEKTEFFGTNADGNKSSAYCNFCYKNGAFTESNITMDEMINKVISFAKKMNMSEEIASQMAKTFIPRLKRWQNK